MLLSWKNTCKSLSEAAKMLNTSVYIIKKLLLIAKEDDIESLLKKKWGSGRKRDIPLSLSI